MQKRKPKIIAISVCAIMLVIVLALNIAVGILHEMIDTWVVGYKKGAGTDAARAEGAALSEQIQAEGTVLVKNDNDTLPLKKTEVPKVNVFGWGSVDWVLSGSGSGQVKRGGTTDLLGALTAYGIEYNTALTSMYKSFRSNREFSIGGSHAGTEYQGNPNDSGSLHTFNYEFSRLYEPSITDKSRYSDALLSDALAYSDTALVVIGRVSGESNDSPKVQYKNCSGKGMPSDSYIDKTRTYLEISTEEEELLKYVGKNYKNVVVLINSTNVMELGFMDTIEGLDSCLVAATTGSDGAKAIPKILYGEVNPSGKLADTYAYDLSTSSTYANTGSGNDTTNFYSNTMLGAGLYPAIRDQNHMHTNGSEKVYYEGVAYTDYCESVYVGYKWYETADTMGFWNSDYAKRLWKNPQGTAAIDGYKDVVQYPFGYGLSYTNFEWEITYLPKSGGTVGADEKIEIGVTVTNTGNVAGQDVVQLYYSAPYVSDRNVEKASVNLGAFGKTTQILEPGKSEYVLLELDVADMASYDYSEKKISGGGYVLEEGDYTLTLRTDAHTLAGKKIVNGDKSVYNSDTIKYRISKDTRVDESASNRFTGTDTTDGVAIDGNSDGTANITYLSRADFENTFPEKMSANREMTDAIKKYNLYNATLEKEWAERHSDAQAVTFGDSSQGGTVGEETEVESDDGKKVKTYVLNELGVTLGKDYDAEEWEGVLNRMTKQEMQNLVLHGYVKTSAVSSIGKPATRDLDGPNQIGSFADVDGATGFSSIVLAQTWNAQLAYSMGLTFGTECISNSITGWYGPGVNIHRSPFGGRNYEYYSEDALISGVMCANVVKAAKNKGVFCWLKHICLYETESGRDGMYTWVTEQALREIYLKPFEIAVKKGGSTAIMTSYGRIGAVWTGGSEALLTEVVRGEWGFKGSFLTDYADHHDFMNGDQMLRAGGDIWMDGASNNGSFTLDTTSAAYDNALRAAAKNLVYTWANALATKQQYEQDIKDGKIDDKITIAVSPELNFRWYIPVLAAVDVLAIGGAAFWLFKVFRKPKENN